MPSPLHLLTTILARSRRRLLIHRRRLAAVCALLAVWWFVAAGQTPGPRTVPVWTAGHDLPAGSTLRPGDLVRAEFLPDSVPAGAVLAGEAPSDLIGRTLLLPMGRGEAVQRRRLLGAGRLQGWPGRVGVPVRLPDPGTAALLRPGDRVDVLAGDPQAGGPARLVADGAVVLAVPPPAPDPGPGVEGRLVLLAVPAAVAADLTGAASSRYLSVIWNR